MERTREAGIKLNDEKCVIKTKKCNFFGMLYTPDGVKSNPDKIRAIEGMETPKDKKELHTVQGAALFQDNKPIAFASRALTPTETRYDNIE